jgi:hypothetical protein
VPAEFRDLTDPRAMRAVAHPLRLQLLEELTVRGPMTATACAAVVGESAASCSYHLRQLARYGFIEEAPGAAGRSRPWQAIPRGHRIHGGAEVGAPTRAAAHELETLLLERDLARLEEWRTRHEAVPPVEDEAWRDAVLALSGTRLWLTADEVAEVRDTVLAVVDRYQHRLADPAARPAGARSVSMFAFAFPDGAGEEAPDA